MNIKERAMGCSQVAVLVIKVSSFNEVFEKAKKKKNKER